MPTAAREAPAKTAAHLRELPDDWVFALPDLHPMARFDGTGNAHRSFDELGRLLRGRFTTCARQIGLPAEVDNHFRVHCLKHDLEVLLLAAPDALRHRLGTDDALRNRWRKPVEDQDDGEPARRIVESLFEQYRKKPGYVGTVDAPSILKRASLDEIRKACPQRFAPFVVELETLANGETMLPRLTE